ncbi:MAG: hypothetical protein LVQ63_06980 [Thermoplasmatales archaeon]|nr:hypothetical protein [Thermoplasmatales archaeon]
MGGLDILTVPDYQKRLDILSVITPFRPGMFISANQEEILRLCEGQLEIAEDELRRWAERHSEDGTSEVKCRTVGANPLTVKILEVKDPEQEIIESNFRDRKQRQRRWQRERRLLE